MKTTKIIAFSLLCITIIGCKSEPKPVQQEERIVEHVDSVTGIASLRAYDMKDTITIGGKQYQYEFRFTPVDSLPVVVNSQGAKYHDNIVSLSIISSDSTRVFSRTFHKSDFASIVPNDFMKHSSLAGFNYNFMKMDDRSAFYFIATVGDPDETSELSFPIEIKITPDGSMSMSKAKDLETDPIHSGMTIDPSDDCGV